MKRFFKFNVLLLTVLCLFSACAEDDDAVDYVVEFSTLPGDAKTFVTTHFSETSVSLVKQYYVAEPDGTYNKVYISGGFEIKFDKLGSWLDIDGGASTIPASVFTSSIALAAIKKYVTDNHASLKIVELARKTNGYKIELSNDLDLNFDGDGKYLGL